MRTLKISTYLEADLETVKSYLMTPALLNYVVAGLMKFHTAGMLKGALAEGRKKQ